MHGVLNLYKPSGPTSHDVVVQVRRAAQLKRVGHAGTLDPAASGVLLVCLGKATRIVEYLMDWPKAYRATAVLGAETDTEDATGSILRETDASEISRDVVEDVLPRFTGEISQVPPMVSAVHHEGRRLYELARAGREVERTPRRVEVHSLRLTSFAQGPRAEAVFDIECSKGTYVRTLCADIGRALDCGAYVSGLIRTAVGRFRIEDAVSLETVGEKAAEGRLGEVLHTIDEVLGEMPVVRVSDVDVARVMSGVTLPAGRLPEAREGLPAISEPARIHGPEGQLLAIGKLSRLPDGEVVLKPEKVFHS